jgi:hypothetical protein
MRARRFEKNKKNPPSQPEEDVGSQFLVVPPYPMMCVEK